jgi:Ras-related GTP-binding protein A/B
LEMELPGFTAVLDELTRNTYIMVIVHDPAIGLLFCQRASLVFHSDVMAETAALRMNIRLARKKFEELQADTTSH